MNRFTPRQLAALYMLTGTIGILVALIVWALR